MIERTTMAMVMGLGLAISAFVSAQETTVDEFSPAARKPVNKAEFLKRTENLLKLTRL